MDIRVGAVPATGNRHDRAATPADAVEARVLAVRRPRRQAVGPPSATAERREQSAERDPLTGRVLVLLIPDGSKLPDGLDADQYRVFLRFARR